MSLVESTPASLTQVDSLFKKHVISTLKPIHEQLFTLSKYIFYCHKKMFSATACTGLMTLIECLRII
jgi:hypothetical protein